MRHRTNSFGRAGIGTESYETNNCGLAGTETGIRTNSYRRRDVLPPVQTWSVRRSAVFHHRWLLNADSVESRNLPNGLGGVELVKDWSGDILEKSA